MIIENKNHVTDRLAPKEDGTRLQSFFFEKKSMKSISVVSF